MTAAPPDAEAVLAALLRLAKIEPGTVDMPALAGYLTEMDEAVQQMGTAGPTPGPAVDAGTAAQ